MPYAAARWRRRTPAAPRPARGGGRVGVDGGGGVHGRRKAARGAARAGASSARCPRATTSPTWASPSPRRCCTTRRRSCRRSSSDRLLRAGLPEVLTSSRRGAGGRPPPPVLTPLKNPIFVGAALGLRGRAAERLPTVIASPSGCSVRRRCPGAATGIGPHGATVLRKGTAPPGVVVSSVLKAWASHGRSVHRVGAAGHGGHAAGGVVIAALPTAQNVHLSSRLGRGTIQARDSAVVTTLACVPWCWSSPCCWADPAVPHSPLPLVAWNCSTCPPTLPSPSYLLRQTTGGRTD